MPSLIEWTDETVNPFRARTFGKTGHHCVKISPGCQFCYSSQMQARFGMPSFAEQTKALGEVFLDERVLQRVLHWKKGRRIFWCSMTDMFLDDYQDEWIDQCFATMALTPQHIHMVLTKRPERMQAYFAKNRRSYIATAADDLGCTKAEWYLNIVPIHSSDWPLPNVYLGVSVENQQYADERIPLLLQTPAAVRFVSYEPALGPITFERWLPLGCDGPIWPPYLKWLIFGGESGPNARPCNIQWAQDARDQCKTAGVPFFMKQFGRDPYEAPADMTPGSTAFLRLTSATYVGLHDRKGGDPSEWPEEDRVREFPR